QGVGIERGDDQEVRPVAELDVQDRVAAPVTDPGPLIVVAEEPAVSRVLWRAGITRFQFRRVEEIEGRTGRHDPDLVPGCAERGDQRRGLDGGDRAGHTEDETSHFSSGQWSVF